MRGFWTEARAPCIMHTPHRIREAVYIFLACGLDTLVQINLTTGPGKVFATLVEYAGFDPRTGRPEAFDGHL